jgi:hypothetical protein
LEAIANFLFHVCRIKGKLHTFHARLKLKNIDREKKIVLRKLRGPEIEVTHYTILYMKNGDYIFSKKKKINLLTLYTIGHENR